MENITDKEKLVAPELKPFIFLGATTPRIINCIKFGVQIPVEHDDSEWTVDDIVEYLNNTYFIEIGWYMTATKVNKNAIRLHGEFRAKDILITDSKLIKIKFIGVCTKDEIREIKDALRLEMTLHGSNKLFQFSTTDSIVYYLNNWWFKRLNDDYNVVDLGKYAEVVDENTIEIKYKNICN